MLVEAATQSSGLLGSEVKGLVLLSLQQSTNIQSKASNTTFCTTTTACQEYATSFIKRVKLVLSPVSRHLKGKLVSTVVWPVWTLVGSGCPPLLKLALRGQQPFLREDFSHSTNTLTFGVTTNLSLQLLNKERAAQHDVTKTTSPSGNTTAVRMQESRSTKVRSSLKVTQKTRTLSQNHLQRHHPHPSDAHCVHLLLARPSPC